MELQLFATLLLILLSWFLSQDLDDRAFFGWWTLGWTAMLAELVLGGLFLAGLLRGTLETAVFFLLAVFAMLQVAFFWLGGRRLRRGVRHSRRRVAAVVGGALALGAAAGAAGAGYLPDVELAQSLQMGPRNVGLALVYPYCALAFFRSPRYRTGAAALCIVGGFLFYGVDQAVYAWGGLRDLVDGFLAVDLPGPGISAMFSRPAFLADVTWEATIGVGTILLLRREERAALKALAQSEERYRELFRNSVDGIFLADGSLRLLDANPSLCRMLGWDETAEPGVRLPGIVAEGHRDDLPDPGVVLRGEGMSVETRFARVDGASFPVDMSLSVYELGGRRVLQGIVRDVTTRKALEERLERQALQHPLTRLPNRYRFREEAEAALARLRRGSAGVAMLFLDLDDFKAVNDELGHLVGDRALVRVGERLREAAREADRVAHLGGDEFTVLLHGCGSEEELAEAARRVASAVEGPCEVDGGRVEVRASVGGALARVGDDTDDLLRRADDAMYRAKESDGERIRLAGRPGKE